MPRPRVLSFGIFGDRTKSPDPGSSPTSPVNDRQASGHFSERLALDTAAPRNASVTNLQRSPRESPPPSSALQERNRAESRASRPTSMIQTLSPAVMDTGDTLPELLPIFSFLNTHTNKLYQEGYFLKLHDLDSRGRPSADRNWTECFAQLVGTVLSLWNAAALDAAGEHGEVLPTFINLSDASIKMIESLPMNGTSGGNLQNVLSISTAANNRYLLHFNSLNSLTQWTAGIRLAMYEQASLQESYTGSLIAGKGKLLNNIKPIMERARFKTEDWARVRFGAGTPWRRCWCVISPPDDKEYAKAQKSLKKKNSYDRKTVVPKGDIKFYDTRKITKKTLPIATISDAFAAYAIYPQSRPLIDQSTLVKLEGLITIHSSPESITEGFIFVMPEVHAAVTGFEMMLRWLFPVWDTFALYGRPSRLVSDTLDQRGLMFAMPRERRYGYLDTLDVSGLIHTEGSQAWGERQWRTELKKLTSHRMSTADADADSPLRTRRNTVSRTSLPGMVSRAGAVRFDGDQLSVSSPTSRKASPAPPFHDRTGGSVPPSPNGTNHHRRSVSDVLHKRFQETPSRLSIDHNNPVNEAPRPPPPPTHGIPLHVRRGPNTIDHLSPEDMSPPQQLEELSLKVSKMPVTPVAIPPAFVHPPSAKPTSQPYQAPELRRATSGMDAATLRQMQEAKHHDESYDDFDPQDGKRAHHEVPIDAMSTPSLSADASTRKELVDLPRHQDQLSVIPVSPVVPSIFADPSKATTDEDIRLPLTPTRKPDGSLIFPASPRRKPVSPDRMSGPRRQSSNHSISRKPVSPDRRSAAYQLPSPARPTVAGEQAGRAFDDTGPQQVPQQVLSRLSEPEFPQIETSLVPRSASPKSAQLSSRTGRLKTVGNPEYAGVSGVLLGETLSQAGSGPQSSPGILPSIDFGPTYSYTASLGSGEGSSLPSPQTNGAPHSPGLPSPSRSYFGGRATPTPAGHTLMDRTGPHESQKKNGTGNGSGEALLDMPRQTLTPEQWVAHRAAMASQPLVHRSSPNSISNQSDPDKRRDSHKRQSSTGLTPPMSRHTSGDWSQHAPHTPPPSGPRPGSRNAGVHDHAGAGPTLLESQSGRGAKAQEQMHVARRTGTPMLDLDKADSRRPRQQDPDAGLYAALQSREREKMAVREGYRGNTVEQALAAQQQQQQQQQQRAQMQARIQMHAQHQLQGQYQQQQQQQQQQQHQQYQHQQYQQQQQQQHQQYQQQQHQQYRQQQHQQYQQQQQQEHSTRTDKSAQFQVQQAAYARSIGAQQAMNYSRTVPYSHHRTMSQPQYYDPYQVQVGESQGLGFPPGQTLARGQDHTGSVHVRPGPR